MQLALKHNMYVRTLILNCIFLAGCWWEKQHWQIIDKRNENNKDSYSILKKKIEDWWDVGVCWKENRLHAWVIYIFISIWYFIFTYFLLYFYTLLREWLNGNRNDKRSFVQKFLTQWFFSSWILIFGLILCTWIYIDVEVQKKTARIS